MRTPTISTAALRSGVQAGLLSATRYRPGFVLATNHLALGECAILARDLIRLMSVMVDLYCASYAVPPAAVTLDIDDTVDVVHGHQQLSLFNAHYNERCFLPIHVYDTATSRLVAVLLRPGKTPSGTTNQPPNDEVTTGPGFPAVRTTRRRR
jgi:hypothetical protein